MHDEKAVTFDGLRARVVTPTDANGAGILQIPAWQGLNDGTDGYARALADEGFTVLSWDPFSSYQPDLPSDDRRRITTGEILDADARLEHVHCVDYLTKELGCKGIGTIGYCMGGRLCMLVGAIDERVGACSAYYPTLRDHVPEWALDVNTETADMATAVQIHYPQLDYVTPYERILDMRLALEARPGMPTTVTAVYAGAHHGFLRPREEPDKRAARLAWPATISFFRSVLLPDDD